MLYFHPWNLNISPTMVGCARFERKLNTSLRVKTVRAYKNINVCILEAYGNKHYVGLPFC